MPLADSDEFQAYYVRIRPSFSLIFNIAHLITGNSDNAEYCVQCAILDCWLAGENDISIHAFRESLRSRTIRISVKAHNDEGEFDWNGLALNDEDTNPIVVQLRREPVENRRALALHYGCGFHARRCAVLCGMDTRKVRNLIRRFERRIARRLSSADKHKFEALLPKIFREILSRPDPKAPEFSAVFRTFQADALETQRPSKLPARILRIVLGVILTLLCVAGFFLAAVLMQPAEVQTQAPTAVEDTFEP